MTTQLWFNNRTIPVSFISSDQKAIPQLLSVLERKESAAADPGTDWDHIDRIEVIGNQAVLHCDKTRNSFCLPLYL